MGPMGSQSFPFPCTPLITPYPAEVLEVGERLDNDLAEPPVLVVTHDVRQVDGHDDVDRVDAQEQRVGR